jgi:hypothetical protein
MMSKQPAVSACVLFRAEFGALPPGRTSARTPVLQFGRSCCPAVSRDDPADEISELACDIRHCCPGGCINGNCTGSTRTNHDSASASRYSAWTCPEHAWRHGEQETQHSGWCNFGSRADECRGNKSRPPEIAEADSTPAAHSFNCEHPRQGKQLGYFERTRQDGRHGSNRYVRQKRWLLSFRPILKIEVADFSQQEGQGESRTKRSSPAITGSEWASLNSSDCCWDCAATNRVPDRRRIRGAGALQGTHRPV